MGQPEVVITGIGMMSSLGDGVTACAAARAGITRPAELSMAVASRDDENPQPVTGHPCPAVEGFEGIARLVYLARLALDELEEGSPLLREAARPIPLLLELPHGDERPVLEAQLEQQGGGQRWQDVFRERLKGLSAKSSWLSEVRIAHRGHAGVIWALNEARGLLAEGKSESCIVGGADSYLDALTLEWLAANDMLKQPNRSVGLHPGEGAAVFLVERADVARRRGCSPLARIGPISLRQEAYRLSTPGVGLQGGALCDAMCEAYASAPLPKEIKVVINDLNGQDVRAREWGTALVRGVARIPALGALRSLIPAASFGDVGAATGAFAVCMATRAFARGYAMGSAMLLCNASEQGERGALVLGA
jgi:3-oxoacyl-[acyl-carrier-protein] synthase-1